MDLAPDGLLGKLSAGDATYVLRDREEVSGPLESMTDGRLAAAVPVTDLAWHPPVSWTLRSLESESDVLRSVEHFATDFRNTVVLNLALVVLASLLGWMALREVRAVERLESERRNLDRVRELELGLMHRDRLAALGRIAAGIAHEINNPLEGMSNYLRLAEDDLAAGEPGAAKQHLEGVAHGLERVAGIVRQTLAQAGDGRGAKDCIDLVPLVERTLDFASDDPKAQNVDVRLAPSNGPAPVVGNATTLGQLVLNLVLNACEAQPTGGEVLVTLEPARDGHVSLAVEDRGPGIGDEDVEHVFEPFYSTKGSTGLGLFLCHAIAADHGGTLRAGHREGGGARFVLELPLANSGGSD
ncbi:MAG: HAMP domain-containing histidine kinase [Thermoanaerobaculia bacterium]|nr:HAMP domain-containing histidine kinase [Thermoanaerobaculia bacterium]